MRNAVSQHTKYYHGSTSATTRHSVYPAEMPTTCPNHHPAKFPTAAMQRRAAWSRAKISTTGWGIKLVKLP